MSQNVELAYESVAIEPFFDAIQELLSGASPAFSLSVLDATTIRLVAGAGDAQQSISIMGRYRFRSTTVDRSITGASGTYSVYVTATDNDFTGPVADLDAPTDYTFGLDVRLTGTPTTALYRKVGEVEWSGTAITALRQTVGERRDTSMIQPTSDIASLTPVRARGVAGQTAALIDWKEVAGGTLLGQIDANGGITLTGASADLSIASTLGITLSGNGGKTTLALTNTTANVGLTIGGDANLYRSAANVLSTDDSLTVAGSLTVTGATTHTGQTLLADGTLALPSIAFTGDPNTGIANIAGGNSGSVSLVSNGIERLRVGPSITVSGAITTDSQISSTYNTSAALNLLSYIDITRAATGSLFRGYVSGDTEYRMRLTTTTLDFGPGGVAPADFSLTYLPASAGVYGASASVNRQLRVPATGTVAVADSRPPGLLVGSGQGALSLQNRMTTADHAYVIHGGYQRPGGTQFYSNATATDFGVRALQLDGTGLTGGFRFYAHSDATTADATTTATERWRMQNDGVLRSMSTAGLLDLTTTAATDATAGSGLGDKIGLHSNGYGFGVQSNKLVAYVPTTAAAFAVRIASGSGAKSSGTDAVTLGGDGNVNALGHAGFGATGTPTSTVLVRAKETLSIGGGSVSGFFADPSFAVVAAAAGSSSAILAGARSGPVLDMSAATVSFATPMRGFHAPLQITGPSAATQNLTGAIAAFSGHVTVDASYQGGTITTLYGGRFGAHTVNGGTVTSSYGVHIDAPAATAPGAITTSYGLYVEGFTASAGTAWSIYSAGSTMNSYFSGKLNLGTTNTTYGGRLNFAAGTTVADGIAWGADATQANLYRSTTNTLRTDGSLVVGTNLSITGTLTGTVKSSGDIGVGPITSGSVGGGGSSGIWVGNSGLLTIVRTSSAGALTFSLTTDTVARLSVTSTGTMAWGDGTAAGDTNLYRDAPNVLRTDDDFYAQKVVVGFDVAGATGLTGQVLVEVSDTGRAFGTYLAETDTTSAFQIAGSGEFRWGVGGTTAHDVYLGRTSAGVLGFLAGNALRFKTSGSAGDNAITRTMAGIELDGQSMNTTSMFTPAIKFMSSDPEFTTENPKLLAYVVGRATQTYSADDTGGMALDFGITGTTPGTTNIPTVGMTLSNLGLNVTKHLTVGSTSAPVTSTIGRFIETAVTVGSSMNGVLMDATWKPTTVFTTQIRGVYSNPTFDMGDATAAQTGALYGALVTPAIAASTANAQAITSLEGVRSSFTWASAYTGTVGFVAGVRASAGTVTGGAVTTYAGIQVDAPAVSGGATIGTAYGVFIEGSTTAATNWGLYVTNPVVRSFVAGSLTLAASAATGNAGRLNFNGSGTAVADGISWQDSANLYRSTTSTLRTDGSLIVGTNLTVTGTTSVAGLTTTGNTRLGDADTDTLGFFSVAGAARQSATTDLKDALTAYGLIQGTSASPLNLDGGALTAGALDTTGNANLGGAASTIGFFGNAGTTRKTGYGSGVQIGSKAALTAASTQDDLIAVVSSLVADLRGMNLIGA